MLGFFKGGEGYKNNNYNNNEDRSEWVKLNNTPLSTEEHQNVVLGMKHFSAFNKQDKIHLGEIQPKINMYINAK